MTGLEFVVVLVGGAVVIDVIWDAYKKWRDRE